jgi:hypothetical protein
VGQGCPLRSTAAHVHERADHAGAGELPRSGGEPEPPLGGPHLHRHTCADTLADQIASRGSLRCQNLPLWLTTGQCRLLPLPSPRETTAPLVEEWLIEALEVLNPELHGSPERVDEVLPTIRMAVLAAASEGLLFGCFAVVCLAQSRHADHPLGKWSPSHATSALAITISHSVSHPNPYADLTRCAREASATHPRFGQSLVIGCPPRRFRCGQIWLW